jgi:predicted CoA-binding protein
LNNCRSLQPNIAIAIVAADSRSNRESYGVLAFQQKAKEASGC